MNAMPNTRPNFANVNARIDALQNQLEMLAEEVALQEGTIERLCIQAVTWDGYDDQVKRIDLYEEAIQIIAESCKVQI